jgi:hypothetical protein
VLPASLVPSKATTDLHHPGLGAQPRRGDQESGQGLFVADPEAGDGDVVGDVVGGQHPKGDVSTQRRSICREARTPRQ